MPTSGRQSVVRMLWLCVPALGAVSCVTRVEAVRTPVPVPESFSQAGRVAMPNRWWTALGDPQLNALVDRALAGNLTVLGAWDRLVQAQAVARRTAADLFPSLTGDADASRTRTVLMEEVPLGGAGGGAQGGLAALTRRRKTTTYTNAVSLGLVASYEVDLWGRVRSTRNAAVLDVRASESDLAAAAITVSAEVANTWYKIVEQRGHIKLLDEQVGTNQDYLELVTLRFRRGKVSASDVLQQRQLVESKRAEKVLAESDLAVLGHQLAVLVGQSPDQAVAGPGDVLPNLPAVPRTGLPSRLLQRRPDVRRAYLHVQAADQRVAAAVADRFPRISLSARAETWDARVRDLFDNWLANMAANLSAPLLDGGERAAEVDRTRAQASERLHAYGQVVLESLREVEDALAQERQQRRFLASVRRQLALSAKVLSLTRESYAKGTMDYLRVLAALRSHQGLQRTVLQGHRALIQFRINLYRALAGDWPLARGEAASAEPRAGTTRPTPPSPDLPGPPVSMKKSSDAPKR